MNVDMVFDYYFVCSLFVFVMGSWAAFFLFFCDVEEAWLNTHHVSVFFCKCRQSSGPQTLM